MSTPKKRFSQAEMKRQAQKAGLRISGDVKKMLSSDEYGTATDRALAFEIAKEITQSLRPTRSGDKVPATTIQPYTVDVAFELIAYCRSGTEESGKKMSEAAIKDLIHEHSTTRIKDGKEETVRVQASASAVKILKLLDAEYIPAFIKFGIQLMEHKKRSTLQDKDVRPLYDSRDKCYLDQE